ncbi:hypothetical protein I4U23_029245 [Adineta vaga]|nr:hypothetical protein I4U23_029245 [Adineta vaga]
MTDQTNNNIRSDLFLKNPKVAAESIEKKRDFLQKKGLTDNEIDYAFKIIPQKQTSQELVPHHRPSFFRRILSDLILAGLIGIAYKFIKRWFNSKRSLKANDLNETLKNLQKTIQDIHTSVKKLEQATDQLHLTIHTTSMNRSSSGSLDEIKREIQSLKGLHLSRSQFPTIPKVPPTLPSWQLEKRKDRSSPIPAETNSKANNEDGDSIVVVSDNGKRSDEENQLSISPSSESSNDV